MEKILLRNAVEEDFPQIQAIYAPYVEKSTVSSEFVAPTVEEMIERFRSYTVMLPWLVVEIDGIIAGYGYAAPHKAREGYKWSVETSIYVSHLYQRRGIARAIYEALFDILAFQGYYNIFAAITTPNEKSIAFHQSMGFIYNGTYIKSLYKFGQWRDVTFVSKNLRPYETDPLPPISYKRLSHLKRYNDILEEAAAKIKRPE